MRLLDLVLVGGVVLVGFALLGGGSAPVTNPFSAGAGNGTPGYSGSGGWLGGNNVSGGSSTLPSNIA